MTTGRINQVTIICGSTFHPKTEGLPRTPAKGRRPISVTVEAQVETWRPSRRAPAGEACKRARATHPIAPTEFSRAWSVAERKLRPQKIDLRCDMHAPKGGYQPPVTSEDGYRLRLTPKCLGTAIANRPAIHRLPQSLSREAIGLQAALIHTQTYHSNQTVCLETPRRVEQGDTLPRPSQ